jgi:hypothetical protein
MRPLPSQRNRHFFLLGAAKAGTTSLHAWLDQHPMVWMSNPKEPFFFEAEFEKGVDYYHRIYFRNAGPEQLLGDARHRNLYLPYIPERIQALCPEARFLVVLRNPVDRAYAHWWHWYRLGREALDFREALQEDESRILSGKSVCTPQEISDYVSLLDADGKGPYRTYLDSGYYAAQLERYFEFFPRERFRILLFEDLISNPPAVVADICTFLGLEPLPAGAVSFQARNSSGQLCWRFAGAKILKRWRYALRNAPASLLSAEGRRALYERPNLEADERQWLQHHYASHNARLGMLLGRDLAEWQPWSGDGAQGRIGLRANDWWKCGSDPEQRQET